MYIFLYLSHKQRQYGLNENTRGIQSFISRTIVLVVSSILWTLDADVPRQYNFISNPDVKLATL